MRTPYVPKWSLYAYVCSSKSSPKELVDAATAVPSSKNVLLVLKYDNIVEKRAGSAYLNMMVRFNDHMNKYKKRSMEMLMLLYADNDIGKNADSVKLNNNKFVLFSDSKVLFDKFVKANSVKKLKKMEVVPDFETDYLMQ